MSSAMPKPVDLLHEQDHPVHEDTETLVKTPHLHHEETTRENAPLITLTQVVATAAAAVTAATAGSVLGTAGTILGAGVASIVTTLGIALYGRFLSKTSIFQTRPTSFRHALQVVHYKRLTIYAVILAVLVLSGLTIGEKLLGRPASELLKPAGTSGTSLFPTPSPLVPPMNPVPSADASAVPTSTPTPTSTSSPAPTSTPTAAPTASPTENQPSPSTTVIIRPEPTTTIIEVPAPTVTVTVRPEPTSTPTTSPSSSPTPAPSPETSSTTTSPIPSTSNTPGSIPAAP